MTKLKHLCGTIEALELDLYITCQQPNQMNPLMWTDFFYSVEMVKE